MLQFTGKKLGPARIIEGQRDQAIEHRVLALVGPVKGFDTDDRHDDLWRDTGFGTNAVEHIAMFLPEFHAALDAPVLDEDPSILVPVELFFRRPIELGKQVLLLFDLGKQFDQFGLGVAGFADHALDECNDIRAALVIAGGNFNRAGSGGDQ